MNDLVYIYMCVCMYMCIYIYICMYVFLNFLFFLFFHKYKLCIVWSWLVKIILILKKYF